MLTLGFGVGIWLEFFFFFFLAGPVSKLLLVLSLPNIYVHVNILLDLT